MQVLLRNPHRTVDRDLFSTLEAIMAVVEGSRGVEGRNSMATGRFCPIWMKFVLFEWNLSYLNEICPIWIHPSTAIRWVTRWSEPHKCDFRWNSQQILPVDRLTDSPIILPSSGSIVPRTDWSQRDQGVLDEVFHSVECDIRLSFTV